MAIFDGWEGCPALALASEKNYSRRTKHGHSAPECSKGFRLERRKPFIIYNELVAGVRFELTTFGL
jgi:hypothetical protein